MKSQKRLVAMAVGFHVTPELVETYTGTGLVTKPATAASMLPSAEEATDEHDLIGAVVSIQLMPELVEV